MDRKDIVRKHGEYIWPAVTHYYEEPLVLTSGAGHYLYDSEGKEYLDFFGGVLTVSVGHGNPEIAEAVAGQVKKLQHTSTLYFNEEMVSFAEKLAGIAPGKLKKCFFTNSGSEANDTALLAAQQHTGNRDVITLRHSYHGRSALTMTTTGDSNWKHGGSHSPGVHHAHTAYCYRCPFKLTYPGCDVQCARDLEDLIETATCGKIAAFIAEPIQGVGGFITPPKEYFTIIHKIVKKYGGLFISDEVQTGYGRTGDTWWGIDHYGVEPDIITCAKGIANGMPCAVTITTDEIAESYASLTFSTFGGNPVSSVAGRATIEYIEKNDLKHNAAVCGDRLRMRLEELGRRHVSIGDVRGMGLMQGVELVQGDREPAPDTALRVLESARRRGLLIGKAGIRGNVLRIAPHLNCAQSDIDEGTVILDRALEEVCG